MTDNNSNIIYQPKPNHSQFRDLEGKKFGRLTIIAFVETRKKSAFWECLCECGKIKIINGISLRNGNTQSCGCLLKEKNTVHGEGGKNKTPEFRIFHDAKNRCKNPKNHAYADYGGRGIEFRFDSLEEFLEEVGRRPSNDHSIDRIDVNGHYEKGNVRWLTQKGQMRNVRTNHLVTIGDETKTQIEWCEIFGISQKTVDTRRRRGACETCAITLPKGQVCSHR